MGAAAELVRGYINGGMSHSAAVKRAAVDAGVNRSELYRLTL
jgi:hypothetical protein